MSDWGRRIDTMMLAIAVAMFAVLIGLAETWKCRAAQLAGLAPSSELQDEPLMHATTSI